jgi:hypothetical protein
LRALVAAAVIALGGCAHLPAEDSAVTIVPFDLQQSGRIVIEVRIDDSEPLDFALDTAASISFVSDAMRAQLGLATVPGVSANVHGLVASGRFPVARADRVQIGSAVWADAELVSIPAETPATATLDGILGIDFLRQYAVGISPQDGVVRLYPPELVSRRAYRGWASVPLVPRLIGEAQEPLYFLAIGLGNQSVPALFDLGAGLNFLNRAGAQYFRLSASGGRRRPIVSGGFDTTAMLARLIQEPVTTGSVAWPDQVFLIGDLEIFDTLAFGDRPLAIVGSGLFMQREFVIDFARSRLLVRTARSEIETPP